MRQIVTYLFSAIIVMIVFQSCSNEPVLHQNITGKANEVIIVISDESWNGKPGEMLRNTLAQQHLALPQNEPVFDLINVPHAGFKKIFRSTRNIIQTSISANVETPGVIFKDDVWAYPQATVEISAKNAAQFEELFTLNSNKIISYFLSAEKKRLTMNYQKYNEKLIFNTLNENFGITMTVPPGICNCTPEERFFMGQV
jgi:hypothetical protein